LDLRDYVSVDTPLYYITLMLVSFIFGTDLVHLRLANAVISLVCILVLYKYLYDRSKNSLRAFVFSLLFMLSPYFLRATIMLFTDNMAVLFAILTLMMLDRSILCMPRAFLSSLFALGAVLTRQLYAWLIGTILFSSISRQQGRIHVNPRSAWPALIPLAGLAFFVYLWKGLTPVRWVGTQRASPLNWDMPVYMVSLVGLYGSFFLPWLLGLYRHEKRGKVFWGIGLVAIGALCLIAHPVSNEYYISERGGALWRATTYLPNLLSSSIVYWVLFPIGLIYVYIMMSYLVRQKNYVMPVSFCLWTAANMISRRTYQRYYEPFVLFFIGYTLVQLKVKHWYDWIGPTILLIGFVGMGFLYFGLGLFSSYYSFG
jgi:hypothetical protein